MADLISLLNVRIFNNTIFDYVLMVLAFFIVLIVLRVVRRVIIGRLKKLTKKSKTNIDDYIMQAIYDIGWPAYVLLSLLISFRFISVPDVADLVLFLVTTIVVTFYATKALSHFISLVSTRLLKSKDEREEEVDTTVIDVLRKIVVVLIWILVFLFILSGFGVNITSAIVGLGAGGIIIGFALQNVMSDLFASFSIFFDKPFKKGDFIIIGNDMGTVEKIGIQTTRIKTLQGQELIVSNRELTSTRVNNYKRMQKRRVAFNFGVTYNTPSKELEKINGIVKEIIDKTKHAELNRVHFKSFGDFSLNFEVVYYVDTNDYNLYMDVQQAINFELKKRLEKLGIEFAFPTQTIHISKTN